MRRWLLLTAAALWIGTGGMEAQELQARVSVNHAQVQGTDARVFKQLEQALQQLLNDRQWTNLQFAPKERINCTFNITVSNYDKSSGRMEATATIQSTRPVYGSAYSTTVYSGQDTEFSFDYTEFDQLNFQPETVDNQLTALAAYYAWLIIGMDLDSFSPMGGTAVLQQCYTLVNNAQSLGFPGWKAFDSDRNRYSIISDYLDEAMRPMRQLQYDYYRKGLDQMSTDPDGARSAVGNALQLLQQARKNKAMSRLPQRWTDYKRDELGGIFSGQGTLQERERVYTLLTEINAAQNNVWEKIIR